MLYRFLLGAFVSNIAGILFPVLSLVSGADRGLLEDAAIVTWNTQEVQFVLTKLLANARLDKNKFGEIPTLVPDIYNLHYLTLCSSTIIPETSKKNSSSTYCNSRWLDQKENMTQILLYAASTGLRDLRNFPRDIWNETAIEAIIDNLASVIVLDHQYDVSSAWSAILCLFTGFAFAVFSAPLVLFATFLAAKQRLMFRTLPHLAIVSALISAVFITISARIVSNMGSRLGHIPPGALNIKVSSSLTFQGFQWAGPLGMWMVVALIWLGGIWRQKAAVVSSRYREKLLGKD